MPIRDFLVIVNPAADRGRAARAVPPLEARLAAAGARWEVRRSERPGHAAELAESAAGAGWPAVVAVGGDGVIHEVANGLLRAAGEAPTLPLGLVPAGSGNDFVKLLGIPPRRPAAAADRLLAAAPRRVDVGRVERCVADQGPEGVWHFTNGVGLGFDAQVATEASRIRRLRGLAIYALALARTLRRLQSPRIRVEVDGRVVADRELVLATIANGACHGGSFRLTPGARLDDGALDVLVAHRRTVPGVLRLIPRVLRGDLHGIPGVELLRGAVVRVRSEVPLPIHADGELVARGVRELDVRVLPGRLTLLA